MTAEEIVLKIVLPALVGQGLLIRLALMWWESRRLKLEHELRVKEEETKTIHLYVEQYYLRYINLSEAVSDIIRSQGQGASEEELKVSFFRLAQWFRARFKWDSEVNSIILLGDAIGEELLVRVLSDVHKDFLSIQSHITLTDYHTLARVLESNPQLQHFFDEFQQALEEEPLADIFQRYKSWLLCMDAHSRERLYKELQCFHRIFSFEIGKCYQSWYRREPTKPKVDNKFIRNELQKLCQEGKINENDRENYLERLGIPLI